MQFKHPELLYALLLLLIPIIVHLFQLRRFQKELFTNVEFLKKVDLQTRKSQNLKKWLTLLTRLLLLAGVILAFAQPYTSTSNIKNLDTETVIYLDNSFSMQAKGSKGELLRRAVQDIIESATDKEQLTLFTNNQTFRNTTISSLRNELLQLPYSPNQLDYRAAILKGKNLFSKKQNTLKNLILISDFQQQYQLPEFQLDSLINTHVVQLQPLNENNISIDSLYLSNENLTNMNLNVRLSGDVNTEVPVSLYNDDQLLSKTSVNLATNPVATFSIASNQPMKGKLTIDDASLQFDNAFYFNINERPKINVLSINETTDDFLKHVYSDDEFEYIAVNKNQLNYNSIEDQDLIILNELERVPEALINAVGSFISQNSNVLIIPSSKANLNSYSQLFRVGSGIQFDSLNLTERRITNINYSHPLFKDVFDKQVDNFQYPKVNSWYAAKANSGVILSFEDDRPFLVQNNSMFAFTAPLNKDNSNFSNSPLIVPSLYNIGRQSFKTTQLYYTIDRVNNYMVETNITQDDILKLRLNDQEIIPQQQTFNNKVAITTEALPNVAGIYEITNNNAVLEAVSYNYNRNESMLTYHNVEANTIISVTNEVPALLNQLKSDININVLWKWFVIFALLMLILEMLILRFL